MHTREEKTEAFGRLLDIMDNLRERCPWNAEQTMESIRPMTEEEVYELSDEIVKDNPAGISKEIGDLLYHMVFYARIAQEKGDFDIADCIEKVCYKMVFRHPHVFRADGSLLPEGEAPSAKEIADTWEIVKAKEKDGNKTVMSGIPDTMPALLKALSMQEKAARNAARSRRHPAPKVKTWRWRSATCFSPSSTPQGCTASIQRRLSTVPAASSAAASTTLRRRSVRTVAVSPECPWKKWIPSGTRPSPRDCNRIN